MFINSGPVAVDIGGSVYRLQPISPDGLSCLVDYIRKNKTPESAFDRVCKKLSGLPASVQEAAITAAIKCDHEETMRGKYAPEALPKSALFDEDVCALMFSLVAGANHPEMTQDKCAEVIKKVGLLIVLAKLTLAFPTDLEKKDVALLAWLSGGPPLTGTNSSESSPPNTNT